MESLMSIAKRLHNDYYAARARGYVSKELKDRINKFEAFMGIKKKQTYDEELLIDCYNELLKETGDTPTVAEVQERFKQRYGSK